MIATALRPYQEDGIAYALRHLEPGKGVIYGLEMGLGKTAMAIETVKRLGAFPCLWITRSRLKSTTAHEIDRWGDVSSSRVILSGRQPTATAEDLRRVCFTIVNHDIIPEGKRNDTGGWFPVLAEVGYQSLVIDEAHDLKSQDSARSKAAKRLATGKAPRKRGAAHAPIPYRLALTGTPDINGRPSELIPLLDILGRLDDFGGLYVYGSRYCALKRTRWGLDLSGATNLDDLNLELRRRCYFRVEKKDVLTDLPPKTYVPLYMELSNRQAYDQLEAEYVAELRRLKEKPWLRFTDPALRAAHATRTTRLRKVVGSGKCETCAEWIEDFLLTGRKLIVFLWHREIGAWLQRRFAHASCGLIDGGTTLKEQERIVWRFNATPVPLVFGNIQAMGTGINGLQDAASDVLMVELPWRPADIEQAVDRAHRIGQINPVFAYLALADGTFDDEMTGTLVEKRGRMDLTTTGRDQESSFVRVLEHLWEKAHRG